jgi:succinate-semialdehyde dehydrogenase / glutarate-semialdehyde dehydrogenase
MRNTIARAGSAAARAAAQGGVYVDGAWRTPHDAPELVVHDPGTGDEVARLPAGGAADARAAIAAAARAFPRWSALSAEERGAPLRRAHALVLERADELSRALTLEQGKPLAEARGEVLWGAEFLLWYAEEIRRPHGG